MTKLTIGLPVFNAMPFLQESLESLLRQTDGDFKILAIDDGSTDSSLEYLRSVQDPRLSVFTQPNRGLTSTLNRMLLEVDTPWLMRHDADDVASAGRVTVTKRFIEQFPDAGMFYSDARYYQKGRSAGTFRTTRATPDQLRQIAATGYLPAICHPTVTLNVEKTLTLGGYRFNLHIEDVDLWWRMALRFDIRYIPEVTAYVRHNAASVSAPNLEYQSINTLYVQYLLLSHLQGWPSMAYELVHEHLPQLIDKPKLRFREHMRSANIGYSQKDYVNATKHLARAAMASPSYFVSRVAYELRRSNLVLNGENPVIFMRQRSVLWPEGVDPAQTAAKSSDTTKGAECA